MSSWSLNSITKTKYLLVLYHTKDFYSGAHIKNIWKSLLPFGVVLGSELRPPFIGVANPLLDATDAALFITLIMTAAAANSASRQELLIGYFILSLVVNNLWNVCRFVFRGTSRFTRSHIYLYMADWAWMRKKPIVEIYVWTIFSFVSVQIIIMYDFL